MNFQTLDSARGNDLPYIGFFPSFATVAWYHKKLSPELQAKSVEDVAHEAEAFASGEYANALQRGSSLSDTEKEQVAKRMSELTGLKETYVLQSHLRVPEFRFFKELLRDEGLTTGRYDARLTGKMPRRPAMARNTTQATWPLRRYFIPVWQTTSQANSVTYRISNIECGTRIGLDGRTTAVGISIRAIRSARL
jgi:carboxypeptidase C (cathepsin A)